MIGTKKMLEQVNNSLPWRYLRTTRARAALVDARHGCWSKIWLLPPWQDETLEGRGCSPKKWQSKKDATEVFNQMNDQVNEWSAKSSVSLGRFSIFKRAFVCTVEGREAIQRELALLSAEPRKLVKQLHKYRTSVFRVLRNFASWCFHQLGDHRLGPFASKWVGWWSVGCPWWTPRVSLFTSHSLTPVWRCC